MAQNSAFAVKCFRYKLTMSGSVSQSWSILSEFACKLKQFEKKSKSNRPNVHPLPVLYFMTWNF